MGSITPSSLGRVFAEIPLLRSDHCKTEFDIICGKLIFPAKRDNYYRWDLSCNLPGSRLAGLSLEDVSTFLPVFKTPPSQFPHQPTFC